MLTVTIKQNIVLHMKKLIFILFTICFVCYRSNAQSAYSKGITPMHQFFKQYADSTIIIEYPSYSNAPPYYQVISKNGDTINCFIYNATDTSDIKFYRKKAQLPKVLGAIMLFKKSAIRYVPADINIFFDILGLSRDTTKSLWLEIQKLKPWLLVDDSNYGFGCKTKKFPGVIDGVPNIIHLVTKGEIRTLIYDHPGVYEDLCPGNKNRQAVVKLYKLFYDKYPKFRLN